MLSVLFCGIGVWQFLIAVSHFAVSHVLTAVSHTNVFFQKDSHPIGSVAAMVLKQFQPQRRPKDYTPSTGMVFSKLKGLGDTEMAAGDRLSESLAFSNRSP